MTRRRRIAYVLAQFAAMGATPAELADEAARLRADAAYYATWCLALEEWCQASSIAHFASLQYSKVPCVGNRAA